MGNPDKNVAERTSMQCLPNEQWARLTCILVNVVFLFGHSCILAYLHICPYLHTCILAYLCILAYFHECILAYMCILAYLHLCILAYLYTCIFAFMCILAYLHTWSSDLESKILPKFINN